MNNYQKGLLLVLSTALISGVSIFLNSYGVKGFDSSVFTFSKNIMVAMALLGIIFLLQGWKELRTLSKKQWSLLVLIGFVGGSIPFLLFFKGLQLTTGTTSAFIHKTLFVYASIFALLFLKEKLSTWFVAGAALLLIGNFLFIRPDFALGAGHALIIVATVLWAAENTLSKYVLQDVSGTVVAFGRMMFGSLFIFMFLLATNKAAIVTAMTFAQYGWVGITSLLLLGYVFTFYNGLKYVPVSVATSILALGSVVTTLLKFAVQGASITLMNAAGMVLITIGVVTLVWFSPHRLVAGSVVPHGRT